MTYVRTLEGWVYVTFIVDLYAKVIVAWNAGCRMTTQLVSDTLTWALWRRDAEGHPVGVNDHLVHHSDHGSQYTFVRYGGQLQIVGITPSFGTVGDAHDNALAEAVNGQYKAECVDQDSPFTNLDDIWLATADWVDWYNNHRLHAALNYRPPTEVENEYYKTQQAATNSGNR
jgi:putative transposase